jgi:hypothetical protein
LTYLRHHRLVFPRRVADEVLELLRAAVVNHSGHRRERAVVRVRKSVQIALCDRCVVSRAGAKESPIAADQRRKRVGYPFDQRSGQALFAHTVTRRTA